MTKHHCWFLKEDLRESPDTEKREQRDTNYEEQAGVISGGSEHSNPNDEC